MRNMIVIALLMSINNAALAEWVLVSESTTTITYADPSSIRRIGNVVRILTLHDFKNARTDNSGNRFTSSKSQDEFDCLNKQTRVVFFSFHAEKLAKGKVVYRDPTPDKWAPIRAHSSGESLWLFVCGKG